MIHDLIKERYRLSGSGGTSLVHCILAHHGELEYGSPKKPAMVEAVALNFAQMPAWRLLPRFLQQIRARKNGLDLTEYLNLT